MAAPVTALILDPENVIFDETLWRRWLRQLLVRMGVAAPFPRVFHAWDKTFRPDVDLGRRSYEDALHAFLVHLRLTEGQITEVLAAALCRKQRFESDRRCLPGVQATLFRLSAAGAPLVVLANTPRPSEAVAEELANAGLRGMFRGVVCSSELGHAMPARAAYLEVAARFDLDVAQTAFVACDARRLRGAARTGLATFTVNAGDEPHADVALERFSDLLRWVEPMLVARRVG
jgi:FMN phosphatase YigB (HAD superfamily)